LAGMISSFDQGVVIYDFAYRTYEHVTDFGQWPVWLPDGRRLLFVSGGHGFYVVDRESRVVRKVLSVDRDVIGPPQLSRDGRWVYYTRSVTEADIWMLTLR
jgi:Tol biopolymer transport system component